MKAITTSAIFSLLLLTTGCATFQANSELLYGRTALLRGLPLEAIPHFERATALDGTIKYSDLQEGGWTYLGRAYYSYCVNNVDSFCRSWGNDRGIG